MDYKNVVIIGTSHIASESLREIKKTFESFKPEVVAVELDIKRLHALNSKQPQKMSFSAVRRIGFKGFLFAVLGRYAQQKLGSAVGVSPGSEMKLAVDLAYKNGAVVALIDQDIEITLKRFSKALTWRERFRFFADILKSVFRRKKAVSDLGLKGKTFDLSKVPEDELVRKLIRQFKRRYPNIYKVLVDDRNKVMASNIVRLMHDFPDKRVLVVVGAGHEFDLLNLVKKKYNRVDVVKPKPSHISV